jgi:hypothetical protein
VKDFIQRFSGQDGPVTMNSGTLGRPSEGDVAHRAFMRYDTDVHEPSRADCVPDAPRQAALEEIKPVSGTAAWSTGWPVKAPCPRHEPTRYADHGSKHRLA